MCLNTWSIILRTCICKIKLYVALQCYLALKVWYKYVVKEFSMYFAFWLNVDTRAHSLPPPSKPSPTPCKRDCASIRSGFATLYVIQQNYRREYYTEKENLGEVLKKQQYQSMNIHSFISAVFFFVSTLEQTVGFYCFHKSVSCKSSFNIWWCLFLLLKLHFQSFFFMMAWKLKQIVPVLHIWGWRCQVAVNDHCCCYFYIQQLGNI